MSIIHYKFHSMVQYKTAAFESIHVTVDELKEVLYEKESLNPEQFELSIENSQTKRLYGDRDVVPRNASVIVKRLPRTDASKMPKVQDTSTSGIVSKSLSGATNTDLSFISSSDYSKMTEEERISHMKQVSTEKYLPSNYKRRVQTNTLTAPPPPNYVCNHCNRAGHWNKNCPLANVKRTTGIPIEDLVEVPAETPGAMLHPSGRYMIQRMHITARLNAKARPAPMLGTVSTETPTTSQEPIPAPAPELICPLCKQLLQEAIAVPCCGISFCADCIHEYMVNNTEAACPGECGHKLTTDGMVPNAVVRKLVDTYRKSVHNPNPNASPSLEHPKINNDVNPIVKPVVAVPPVEKKEPEPFVPIRIDLTGKNPTTIRLTNGFTSNSQPTPMLPVPSTNVSSSQPNRSPSVENADNSVPTNQNPSLPSKSSSSTSSSSSPSDGTTVDEKMETEENIVDQQKKELEALVSGLPFEMPDLSKPPPSFATQASSTPPSEAAAAFAAFNPMPNAPEEKFPSDLIKLLPDADVPPPGSENIMSLIPGFQPIGIIDPVTGLVRSAPTPKSASKSREHRRDSGRHRSSRHRDNGVSKRSRSRSPSHKSSKRHRKSPSKHHSKSKKSSHKKHKKEKKSRKHSHSPSKK